jgi:hypothetical protein
MSGNAEEYYTGHVMSYVCVGMSVRDVLSWTEVRQITIWS